VVKVLETFATDRSYSGNLNKNMKKRIWIKLYLEILDDNEFGTLPEFMKWRAIELFLVAGENGNDGALPPVERLAWRLRLPQEKLEETLSALAQVGVVHETDPGVWCVTHFKERQTSESYDRVKRYRERYSNGLCNEEETEVPSTSSSSESISDSFSLEEGGWGEKPPGIPRSPGEAMVHPDLRVFAAVTGGRIPGLKDYRAVIDAVRILRQKKRLDDLALAAYLAPFWRTWSSRKRQDGRPYDKANISWLTDWALNGSMPDEKKKKPDVERMVDWFLNKA
jgi:hypothetical protein